jgi:hypothetical protein
MFCSKGFATFAAPSCCKCAIQIRKTSEFARASWTKFKTSVSDSNRQIRTPHASEPVMAAACFLSAGLARPSRTQPELQAVTEQHGLGRRGTAIICEP